MQKRFLPGQPRSCRELRVSASQTQLLLAKSSGACFWGWGSPRSPRPPKPAAAEMSSQKGNVTRTRSQRHQNAFSFRNDKFDSSVRTKRINAKLHDGVCQHCKEVLEWRVKYSKYKPLSKPKKCVKCLQKTVKDSYHMICRPCACELEVCAKCGKKEEIVLPITNKVEKTSDVESDEISNGRRNRRFEEQSSDELDSDLDLNESEDEQNDHSSYAKNKSASART